VVVGEGVNTSESVTAILTAIPSTIPIKINTSVSMNI
jgi:hypothetical protein